MLVYCKELGKSDCFQESHCVFTVLPFQSEVITFHVIFEAGPLWEKELHETKTLV